MIGGSSSGGSSGGQGGFVGFDDIFHVLDFFFGLLLLLSRTSSTSGDAVVGIWRRRT